MHQQPFARDATDATSWPGRWSLTDAWCVWPPSRVTTASVAAEREAQLRLTRAKPREEVYISQSQYHGMFDTRYATSYAETRHSRMWLLWLREHEERLGTKPSLTYVASGLCLAQFRSRGKHKHVPRHSAFVRFGGMLSRQSATKIGLVEADFKIPDHGP